MDEHGATARDELAGEEEDDAWEDAQCGMNKKEEDCGEHAEEAGERDKPVQSRLVLQPVVDVPNEGEEESAHGAGETGDGGDHARARASSDCESPEVDPVERVGNAKIDAFKRKRVEEAFEEGRVSPSFSRRITRLRFLLRLNPFRLDLLLLMMVHTRITLG